MSLRAGVNGELLEVARIIADETGKYSGDDKNRAYVRFNEISRTNLFDYGVDERTAATELVVKSSYYTQSLAASDKFARLKGQFLGTDSTTGAGPDASAAIASLRAGIAAFDQLTPSEKATPYFNGFRERSVALLGMYERLQARVDAGAFTYGTSEELTRDPEAKTILGLFKQIDRISFGSDGQLVIPKEFAPYLQRGYELLGEGGFGTIQDTISLSPQARQAMGA